MQHVSAPEADICDIGAVVAAGQPVVFAKAAKPWPAMQWRLDRSVPSGLRRPDIGERTVKVAVVERERTESIDVASMFAGDDERKQIAELEFGIVLDIADAASEGKQHSVSTDVGLAFYLCQCPIAGSNVLIPELAEDIILDPFFSNKDVKAINLWIGSVASQSNSHFDIDHNILTVVRGSKRVIMSPPSAVASLGARPVWRSDFHHSTGELGMVANSLPPGTVIAEIRPGDSLFIPEGWWHQVESDPATVAVNVWFAGIATTLGKATTQTDKSYELLTYTCRVMLARLVELEGEKMREEIVTKSVASVEFTADLEPASIVGKIMAAVALNNVVQSNQFLCALSACTLLQQQSVFRCFTLDQWEKILLLVEPATANILNRRWTSGIVETQEDLAAFYAHGFGHLPGNGYPVLHRLAQCSESFCQSVWHTISGRLS